MTGRDDGESALPKDVAASLENIWEAERGSLPDGEPSESDAAASEAETGASDAETDEAILERVALRPQIEHLCRKSIDRRDGNRPQVIKRKLRSDQERYDPGQDRTNYLQGKRCVALIDEFSELAEELLAQHGDNPELAITITLERLVEEKAQEGLGVYELQEQLKVLCVLSERYRQDVA